MRYISLSETDADTLLLESFFTAKADPVVTLRANNQMFALSRDLETIIFNGEMRRLTILDTIDTDTVVLPPAVKIELKPSRPTIPLRTDLGHR